MPRWAHEQHELRIVSAPPQKTPHNKCILWRSACLETIVWLSYLSEAGVRILRVKIWSAQSLDNNIIWSYLRFWLLTNVRFLGLFIILCRYLPYYYNVPRELKATPKTKRRQSFSQNTRTICIYIHTYTTFYMSFLQYSVLHVICQDRVRAKSRWCARVRGV